MKKITMLTIVMLVTFFISLTAQEVMVVEPGLGTLNAAITANGGDKIYELKAGEWYGLDAIIENDGYHLQIIGEVPAEGAIPATLQTGSNAEGAPFGSMINGLGDITLKNVYFVNADLAGQIPGTFMAENLDSARVIIDKCILDPATGGNGILLAGNGNKLYFTNNLVVRAGHMLNPNDGHFFVTSSGASPLGADTMWVENNTFVTTGTNIWMGGFNSKLVNFVWFNHNTFAFHKSQMDWNLFENEYFFTNNLMFDFQTQPWAVPWGQGMPGGDPNTGFVSLIYADTLTKAVNPDSTVEVLPSQRKQFIEYNSQYRAQGFYDLVNEINALVDDDSINNVYLQPIIWESEPQASESREAKLFADDVNFPNWKYGNSTADIDPQWADSRIYDTEAKFVEWTRPATYIHALGFPADQFPAPIDWPQWHWDPDGDPSRNDTWPVFDGTYKNPALLTASIEKLPLGDLNWYPEAMATWKANRTAIEAHIMSLNEGQFDVTGVETLDSAIPTDYNLSQNYPNPFNPTTNIQFSLPESGMVSLKVFNILGQEVANLVNQELKAGVHKVDFNASNLTSGIYFYTLESGSFVQTQKMMLLK